MRRYLLLIIGFVLLFALSACGGLSGEPQIVMTRPPVTVVAEPSYPATPPDLLRGAQIYAEKCTRCHGVTGQSDGDMVTSGKLTNPPTLLSDPATASGQTLETWYNTISNGRLDKFMPNWNESLTEAERWDVALYTYTFAYQPDAVQAGKAVWDAQCADCHGATGLGDGQKAASEGFSVANLADPQTQASLSDAMILDTVAAGKGDHMPAFGDKLSEAERTSVVAYLRTLFVATNPFGVAPVVTVSATTAAVAQPETTAEVGATAVPSTPAANATTGAVAPEVTAEVSPTHVAYEITDDPSVITITNMLTQILAENGELQIAYIISFHNSSDKVYSQTIPLDATRFASVSIPLPAGIKMQNAGDIANYAFSDDGRYMLDTRPVLPGEDRIVHALFSLPYKDGIEISYPLDYAVNGTVSVFLAPTSLHLNSTALTLGGQQSMSDVTFDGYGAPLALDAGGAISYTLTGEIAALPSSTTATTATSSSTTLLAAVLIVVGSLALLASAVFYWYGRRFPATGGDSKQALREMLIQQIAELDNLNQQKQISSKAYKEQRQKLKEQLSKLMGE